jgi:hypothetical protein
MTPMVREVGFRVLERTLRREFRRIVWLGDDPPSLPEGPVVLYANHHAFYDGQVLAYLVERVLGRRAIVWVEEADRFPFLKTVGAMSFPHDDRGSRMATIRGTARALTGDPATVLIYFPEGRLHPWDEGLTWPDDDRVPRLGRLARDVVFWPVAMRVAGWEDHKPTAYLKGGHWHRHSTGLERHHIDALMRALEYPGRHSQTVLLEGRPGPHQRWNFSALDPIFSRLT